MRSAASWTKLTWTKLTWAAQSARPARSSVLPRAVDVRSVITRNARPPPRASAHPKWRGRERPCHRLNNAIRGRAAPCAAQYGAPCAAHLSAPRRRRRVVIIVIIGDVILDAKAHDGAWFRWQRAQHVSHVLRARLRPDDIPMPRRRGRCMCSEQRSLKGVRGQRRWRCSTLFLDG
jgi:hypothetical protein